MNDSVRTLHRKISQAIESYRVICGAWERVGKANDEMPNHCQVCGAWGTVRVHLNRCPLKETK